MKHFACLLIALAIGCARSKRVDPSPSPSSPATGALALADAPALADAAVEAAPADSGLVDAAPAPVEVDGPHELALEPGRPIYYASPRGGARPLRLVAHLHGVCGGPPYACGKWLSAGVEVGAVVCPTGNAKCPDSPASVLPSWEAPSWSELVAIMNEDLEASVAKVEAKHRGSIRRDGAVLTGYSRGAYAAAVIARQHKDLWPYLVLIEANVSLTAASLRAAGIHAVALVAGEQGDQIGGMRATVEALDKDGFPARLFVMKKTGHLYSEDVEVVMRDALAYVLRY